MTRPGLPGTGFATGNCVVTVAGVAAGGDAGFDPGFDADRREVAVLRRLAERGVGDFTGTGRPGFVTSELLATGVGSGSLNTYRTGEVRARPTLLAVSQLISAMLVTKINQPAAFIEGLYELIDQAQLTSAIK